MRTRPDNLLDGLSVVCGIDPGLRRTGYAIVARRRGDLCVVEAGVLRPAADDLALAPRLATLAGALDEVLEQHRPEAIVVEQLYAHYKHPRTAILMAHARGAILLTAARRGLPVIDVAATSVKRYLTGSGHAGKDQMQVMVARVLGLPAPPEPPDVADALALAMCALHRYAPGAARRGGTRAGGSQARAMAARRGGGGR